MNCRSTANDRRSAEHGASLIEVMVAALILVVGVFSIARLFAVATASNVVARSRTVATILAQQKLEELRVANLQPSTAGALLRNTSGYVEHLDSTGTIVGQGPSPPPQAVYTRRWSIEPTATDPGAGLVIEVRVVVKTGPQPVQLATTKRAQ